MSNDNQNRTAIDTQLIELTTDIVSAYVSNTTVAVQEIPEIINIVYGSLKSLRQSGQVSQNGKQPAVPINKSITAEFIICLEDGKKLKMLKRHLRTTYNLSPEEYRKRWNLPSDYPMVAPNYAKIRSGFAKEFGLGKVANKSKSA